MYKQTQTLLLSPIFLSLVYNELHNVYGWHLQRKFLSIFTVCKLAFVI